MPYPWQLRRALVGHTVETAYERGWSQLQNGGLISAAEAAGFEALVTAGRNFKYQQNLSARKLSNVVLLTTSWPRIQGWLPVVVAAVDASIVKGYAAVNIA